MNAISGGIGKELRNQVTAIGFSDRLGQGAAWSGRVGGEVGWDVVHLLVDAIVGLEQRLDALHASRAANAPCSETKPTS